ncbi:MAG: hypothetical protein M0Z71_12535 [Nitrospiraceae bacterium]|nr:hypothetical protein [Nitrospiraceae bacterium]
MGPTIGRIVHYKITEKEVRPAIIVKVHSETCVNLQVFYDGGNDAALSPIGMVWKTSIVQGNGVGEWQWPR